MVTRRDFIVRGSAIAGGAALLASKAVAQDPADPHGDHAAPADRPQRPDVPPPSDPGPVIAEARERQPVARGIGANTPVVTPNGVTLPYRLVGGVKVFHLVAEPVPRHEFAPGLVADCWGYNGRTPGPTIEVLEGDRLRIYVTNKLPEPTSVHWHGFVLPNGMDGVAGLTQAPIPVGATFKYEFVARDPTTYMYHPHFDEMTQMALGMMGMFIVHPRVPRRPRADREFAIMLSEWSIQPGAARPDPAEMNDFNLLTMNSKAFPGTEPLVVRQGERVRIRFGNLSAMDHHPIHLHGHHFDVVATDGGPIPPSAQWPENTVLVPVGATRDIEFVANNPGDWAMHCHMTHHVMNQMGHDAPNMIGVDPNVIDRRVRSLVPGYMTMGHDGMGAHAHHLESMEVPRNSIPMRGGAGPFGHIDMGGMFTILKVRPTVRGGESAEWYAHPPGTVADVATAAEMRDDGIDPTGEGAARG